ncbi:hypothetical protein ENUP19_0009G0049 [Entamoeba nuttalli]|uniref:Rab GTPase activating protein, putative n=2 Tax=Entamoeba nuttalli TaxID=412467 RepID=K2H398_ENTNP|nr:Rab GTPase activating protein, putative [Entamoeba nuttalli P19]EKE36909.1 Rab GTPase activating protein, putative [Entamoeba nuttalli P19]|eukprot:XP_008860774.1 Rab GTPase activating protein, putative [Entamoeba nuttalli P19]
MTNNLEYIKLKEIFRCYYLQTPNLSLLKQIALNNGLDGLLRKLGWLTFLDVLPLPITPSWGRILEVMRERYDYFIVNDNKPTQFDEIIDQDIERLYSDIEFFIHPEVRNSVKRICKIFAIEHPDVGYQQGIHELVGIVYYAFSELYPTEKAISAIPFPSEYESTFQIIIENGFTEHDTFTAIEHLIALMQPIFSKGANGVKNMCNDLFNSLQKFNQNIFDRFNENGIIPTTFGIKWLRLLFSREFPLDTVLQLWDGIFAFGNGLIIIRSIFILLMLDCSKEEEEEQILVRLMQCPTKNVTNIHRLIHEAIVFDKQERAIFQH